MENRISDTDLKREEADRRDLEIINQNADRLNAEAEDALGYQSMPQDSRGRDQSNEAT